jgi:hypothetical protein
LLASAPEAQPFLPDWPSELIARPVGARSLPVVAALRGLARLAAPRERALVEGIEALAGELDWRQTYSAADFGELFLETYGYNEWIGQRGAFMSDRVACGVLLLGPETEYPDHSHEAEELYLPLYAATRLELERTARLAGRNLSEQAEFLIRAGLAKTERPERQIQPEREPMTAEEAATV